VTNTCNNIFSVITNYSMLYSTKKLLKNQSLKRLKNDSEKFDACCLV